MRGGDERPEGMSSFVSPEQRMPKEHLMRPIRAIGRYLDVYNRGRPHWSLDGTTPDHAYFTRLPLRMAA